MADIFASANSPRAKADLIKRKGVNFPKTPLAITNKEYNKMINEFSTGRSSSVDRFATVQVKQCHLKALRKLAIANKDRDTCKSHKIFNRVLRSVAIRSGFPMPEYVGSGSWWRYRESFISCLDINHPEWRGYRVRYTRIPDSLRSAA